MGTGKKVNLAEVFRQNEEPQKPELEVVESPPTGKKKVAPSREKKIHIGGYFSEPVYRQLKIIGIEKHKSTQGMLTEMLNAYFERNGKPPIA